jgi:hypothetical protein
MIRVEVYSDADSVAREAAKFVAAEARTAVAAWRFCHGRERRAHSLADAARSRR